MYEIEYVLDIRDIFLKVEFNEDSFIIIITSSGDNASQEYCFTEILQTGFGYIDFALRLECHPIPFYKEIN